MTLEEAIVAKLQQVPEGKREKVLLLLDEWIEQQSPENTRAYAQLAAFAACQRWV